MLVFEKRPTWLGLVLSLRGSPLKRTRYRLLFVLCVSLLLTVWQEKVGLNTQINLQTMSLLGVSLGIFLGFRNNAAYDRYWEGRRLWGSLVNTSRSLARNLVTYLPAETPPAVLARLIHWQIAFVHALRLHLRNQPPIDGIEELIPSSAATAIARSRNVPNAVLLQLSRELQELADAGSLSEYRFVELSRQLSTLSDIQGGCERIKNTPIPYSYTVIIHQVVALYVLSLPFGLVGSLHYLTPVVVLIIAYAFLGLDAVGDEIEDPFGEDLNDLPLAALSRTIEVNLRETLGEDDVPPYLKPQNGVLL
jgi:ion channel-forming bestrophin family protein